MSCIVYFLIVPLDLFSEGPLIYVCMGFIDYFFIFNINI
jgi:hypothetical protein